MRTISRVVLSVMLVCSVALAESVPPAPTAAADQSAQRRARRRESFKNWWLWSLVAVLSTGTIVTSVVIATVPRGSLNPNESVGVGNMAMMVRF
jgi:anti-sigma factor RsiW